MKQKPLAGSHPEEHYVLATRKRMFLDRPTSHGGWPEGEYDPPVADSIYGWYKKMGMMPEGEEGSQADEYIEDHKGKKMKITESMLRRIIREEYARMSEADGDAAAAVKAFRAKTFKTEAEMQAAKKTLADALAAAGAKGEDKILASLESAGYDLGGESFASELAKMQGSVKESQRGNDENSQHDNDTIPGDPMAKRLKESARRDALRRAILAEMNRR
jgi:hypothetical protein